MAGDTEDCGRSTEAWSSFSGKRLLAGFPDGETGGRVAVAEFVGTVAATGAWAAHRPGSTGASSNAVAAIEDQTVPFFMTMLTPFSGSSCRPGHEAVPPGSFLYVGRQRIPRQPDRSEITAEIISTGFRGHGLIDRRVRQSIFDADAPLRTRTVGNNPIEKPGEFGGIVRHPEIDC